MDKKAENLPLMGFFTRLGSSLRVVGKDPKKSITYRVPSIRHRLMGLSAAALVTGSTFLAPSTASASSFENYRRVPESILRTREVLEGVGAVGEGLGVMTGIFNAISGMTMSSVEKARLEEIKQNYQKAVLQQQKDYIDMIGLCPLTVFDTSRAPEVSKYAQTGANGTPQYQRIRNPELGQYVQDYVSFMGKGKQLNPTERQQKQALEALLGRGGQAMAYQMMYYIGINESVDLKSKGMEKDAASVMEVANMFRGKVAELHPELGKICNSPGIVRAISGRDGRVDLVKGYRLLANYRERADSAVTNRANVAHINLNKATQRQLDQSFARLGGYQALTRKGIFEALGHAGKLTDRILNIVSIEANYEKNGNGDYEWKKNADVFYKWSDWEIDAPNFKRDFSR